MDSFFASVEVLDQPELAGRPVIVGGTGTRGVVASCTYEARAFGIHSAMPTSRARQLCPDAVYLAGRYSRYQEVSSQLREVLTSVTPLVEPVGLDEAFLDVTGARRLLGSPATIAETIRTRVRAELSLACCVGVGRSKMIAKLASRAAKPSANPNRPKAGAGVVVVMAEEERRFLHPLPVEALWGVGPATKARLGRLGIVTVGDLAAVPRPVLVRQLGQAHGNHLSELAQGHDPDPVVPDRPAKSLGHEETFRHDIDDLATLQRHVVRMSESVAGHLRDAQLAGRTVSVKVKFGDFSLLSRSHTLPTVVDTAAAVTAVASALLASIDVTEGVRLLGVSLSGLEPTTSGRQLAFDLGTGPGAGAGAEADAGAEAGDGSDGRAMELQATWEEVTGAVDAIRARFGRNAVGSVSMVSQEGIAVPRRRDAPWGPAAGPEEGSA